MALIAVLVFPPVLVRSEGTIPVPVNNSVAPYIHDYQPPKFPDMSQNYANTVVVPQAQASCEAISGTLNADLSCTPPPAPPPPVEQPTEPQNAPQTAYAGNCSAWMASAGITDTYYAMLVINRESGCNPSAVNASSGACGLGQQLPCGKWPHTWNDPVGALVDAQAYVISSYGSWANAYASEVNRGWY